MLDLFLKKVVEELSLDKRYVDMICEQFEAEINFKNNQPELSSALENIKNKYADLDDYVKTGKSEKSDVGVYYFSHFSTDDMVVLPSLVESYNLNLQTNYHNQTLTFTLKS